MKIGGVSRVRTECGLARQPTTCSVERPEGTLTSMTKRAWRFDQGGDRAVAANLLIRSSLGRARFGSGFMRSDLGAASDFPYLSSGVPRDFPADVAF